MAGFLVILIAESRNRPTHFCFYESSCSIQGHVFSIFDLTGFTVTNAFVVALISILFLT